MEFREGGDDDGRSADDLEDEDVEVAIPFLVDDIPGVGSSISTKPEGPVPIKSGSGTMGGYIAVNGQKYALTNNHVVWGREPTRYEPYHVDKALDGSKVCITQPSQYELRSRIEKDEKRLRTMRTNPARFLPAVIEAHEQSLEMLKSWDNDKSILGSLYISSGEAQPLKSAREGLRHRLDFALIKPANKSRFGSEEELVNTVNKNPCCILSLIIHIY